MASRKLFFHVPAYLPPNNLIASYQSQTFDKKKGDAPMSEYADSHLTVAPHFLCTWQFFFFGTAQAIKIYHPN